MAPRAQQDVRRLPEKLRRQVRRAHEALAQGAANLDVRPLAGRSPWLRLRHEEFRTIFRPLTQEEMRRLGTSRRGYLVARVVNKKDADKAIRTL